MTYEQWCESRDWKPTDTGKVLWQAACEECRVAIQDAIGPSHGKRTEQGQP